jgi:preprotein translocase subunit Sec63
MADRFLLLCCRSCLKGEDNTELYEILAIDRRADGDAIKKAYKKASLNLHPDKLAQRGIEQTNEHKQEFLKVCRKSRGSFVRVAGRFPCRRRVGCG